MPQTPSPMGDPWSSPFATSSAPGNLSASDRHGLGRPAHGRAPGSPAPQVVTWLLWGSLQEIGAKRGLPQDSEPTQAVFSDTPGMQQVLSTWFFVMR